MTDYVKKLEGFKQVGQAKALSNRTKNVDNYNGSYSKGPGKQV